MLVLLAGCATTTSNNPRDPFEGFNRAMFSFNEGLDGAVVKPIAEGYRAVLPTVVSSGITNFFANIQDPWIAVNNALQGKFAEAVQDVMRFVVNSVFGLAGLIDIASDMNLQKHNEDFGQTLGKWGMGSGAYLVLPFFGPSSIRDGIGLAVDWDRSPLLRDPKVPVRNSLISVLTVNRRANLLEESRLLEEAAIDKYTFTRDAFFQYRRNQIYDGNAPPLEPDAQIDPDESAPHTALLPSQERDAVSVASAPVAGSLPPASPAVLAQAPPARMPDVDLEATRAPSVFTVFPDGVVLKTPNAEPGAAPHGAVKVVHFSDDVILQTR